MFRALPLAAIFALGACAAPLGPTPTLAPRAAEAIDPRVPVVGATVQRAVDPALASRLSDLVGRAQRAQGAFVVAAGEAQRLAGAAGAPQSEAWIAAQQALTAAVAARAPTTQALADIDATGSALISKNGGMAPADLAAIEAAAAEVGAIDRSQAQVIEQLQARIGG